MVDEYLSKRTIRLRLPLSTIFYVFKFQITKQAILAAESQIKTDAIRDRPQ